RKQEVQEARSKEQEAKSQKLFLLPASRFRSCSGSLLLRIHVFRVDDFVFLGAAARRRAGAGPLASLSLRSALVHRLGDLVSALLKLLRRPVHVVSSAGLESLSGIREGGFEARDIGR